VEITTDNPILAARSDYESRGWKCVPLTDGKSPRGVVAWQSRTFTADDFATATGVGVQIGPCSGIIDAEWDTPAQHDKLVELCGQLPDGPEFSSRQGGHKLFAWSDDLAAIGSAVADFECADGSTLKIRVGAGGKGAQSAFPPSPNKAWLPGKSPAEIGVPPIPASLLAAMLAAAAGKGSRASGPAEWSNHAFSESQRAACREALAELPDAVSGENGQTKLMSAMRCIRRHVGNYEQALELAAWFNDEKCVPPFDETEVERKLNESDEPPRRHADDDFDAIAPWDGGKFPYKFYSSAELDAADFRIEFLIDNALVAGQPLFIAGPSKSLKTSIMLDAAVALASQGSFLDTFTVNRRCGVVVMSGESGLPVIRETAQALCRRRGLSLASLGNLQWSGDLPEFGDPLHAAAIEQALRWFGADVLFIDPLYLALPAEDAANSGVQGRLIRSLVRVCEKLGVVLGVAAHTRKLDHSQPLSLNEIAYSAGPQIAGQWWLLNRREKYADGSGEHRLWLSIGGRAKFSSVWGVDVTERAGDGLVDAEWGVTTFAASAAKSADRERRQGDKAEDDAQRIRDYFARIGNAPRSRTAVGREALGTSNRSRIDGAIDYLAIVGDLESCDCNDGRNRPVAGGGVRLSAASLAEARCGSGSDAVITPLPHPVVRGGDAVGSPPVKGTTASTTTPHTTGESAHKDEAA
jgi:hypothetical protein